MCQQTRQTAHDRINDRRRDTLDSICHDSEALDRLGVSIRAMEPIMSHSWQSFDDFAEETTDARVEIRTPPTNNQTDHCVLPRIGDHANLTKKRQSSEQTRLTGI